MIFSVVRISHISNLCSITQFYYLFYGQPYLACNSNEFTNLVRQDHLDHQALQDHLDPPDFLVCELSASLWALLARAFWDLLVLLLPLGLPDHQDRLVYLEALLAS